MATTSEIIRHDGGSPSLDHGTSASDTMGQEVARAAELGTAQLEAQARAVTQARFWMAKQPGMIRSWDNVEQKLRKECARPGFANSAWWILPLGGDPKKYPSGLSIRFAESALRVAGNIDVQQAVVFDDQWKRIVRITVMDLESNFAYTSEQTIEKTVERSDPKGREVLSYRQNSYGKMTYVVAASEQEIALKQGSSVSKAIRTNGLRLIPGDILDGCKQVILATRAKGAAAEDPEAARKSILDNFAEISVMPNDIARLVEHDTDHFLPADRELLRGVYAAIKNGVATWKEVIEAKFGPAEGSEESEGAKRVKEAIAKRAAGKQSVQQPTTADPKPEPQQATSAPAQPADTEPSAGTPKSYDEFPECPPEDGVPIIVRGNPYVSTSGNWRDVGPKKQKREKSGGLFEGETK